MQGTPNVIETHARMGASAATLGRPSPVTAQRSLRAALVNFVRTACLKLYQYSLKMCLFYGNSHSEFTTIYPLLHSFLAASIKACDSSPCHNGGTCVNSGDSFTCICKDGYEGPLCEADINNCNPFPW